MQTWNTDEKVAYQQVLFEVQVSLDIFGSIIPLLLAADRKDPAFRPLGQYWCKVFR